VPNDCQNTHKAELFEYFCTRWNVI